MIKHVVMWKFQPGKEEEMRTFLERLQNLYGVIPQIRSQETGINYLSGNYDAVSISTFDSREDLDAYKADPRHQEVSALCKAIRTDRTAVDFEV